MVILQPLRKMLIETDIRIEGNYSVIMIASGICVDPKNYKIQVDTKCIYDGTLKNIGFWVTNVTEDNIRLPINTKIGSVSFLCYNNFPILLKEKVIDNNSVDLGNSDTLSVSNFSEYEYITFSSQHE